MGSYLHCELFLVLDRLALMHYTRFRSTIPCHGRPWVEHGVTTECSTIRVIVRALIERVFSSFGLIHNKVRVIDLGWRKQLS